MIMQMESPVRVLQQRLAGKRPMDETVLSAAVNIADRLSQLKAAFPMFEAISLSPDVEAMLTAEVPAVN
jgi:hypothetical protein